MSGPVGAHPGSHFLFCGNLSGLSGGQPGDLFYKGLVSIIS